MMNTMGAALKHLWLAPRGIEMNMISKMSQIAMIALVATMFFSGIATAASTCVDGQKGPCYTPQGELCDYHKLSGYDYANAFEGYYSAKYGCINACGIKNAGPCQCYDMVCEPGYTCNTQNGIKCIKSGSNPFNPSENDMPLCTSSHTGSCILPNGEACDGGNFGQIDGSSEGSYINNMGVKTYYVNGKKAWMIDGVYKACNGGSNQPQKQYGTCSDGQQGPCYTPSGQFCDYQKLKFEGYYSAKYGCINACGMNNAGPCQCYSLVCNAGEQCNTQNGIQCIKAGTDPFAQKKNLTVPSLPDSTATIKLMRGWNLVSIPAELAGFEPVRDDQKPVAFVYLADTNKFVPIAEAQSYLGSGFNAYMPNYAFWVYSYSESSLVADLKASSQPVQYSLRQGWNFVPLTEMAVVEKVSARLSGCDVERAYFWNAGAQKWDAAVMSSTIGYDKANKGMIVKAASACKIGVSAGMVPPQLPE